MSNPLDHRVDDEEPEHLDVVSILVLSVSLSGWATIAIVSLVQILGLVH